MEVKGRNLAEGIPRSFTVSSNEILEALTDPLNSIVSAVKSALERTPPELGADIAERGMVLTGGGALLRDVDRLLMEETGLPVIVADDPLTCVVRGCGKALENMEKLHDDLHVSDWIRADGRTWWRATRRSYYGLTPSMHHIPVEPPPFFHRGPSPLARLAFFGLLSIALLFVDTRYRYLEGVRQVVAVVLYPLQRAVQLPGEALGVGRRATSRRSATLDRRERRR